MLNLNKIFLLLAVCLFSSYAHAAGDLASEAGLIPYKALYEIRLSSKKSGSVVSNIGGKMMYDGHSSCDGWVSNFQFDMLYEYVAMPVVRITSDFSTYESFDGKSFNFTVQRKKDGYPFESFRGAAQGDKIIYTEPEGLVQNLPEGTLFPMGHTIDVLNNIRKGKRFFKATLFDGSDGEGPAEVNVFAGNEYTYKLSDLDKKDDIDQDLVNTKAWNLRLAFFPPNTSDTIADYEMSVVFHENGVISYMEIEYEDFSIVQDLIALQSVESGCDMEK